MQISTWKHYAIVGVTSLALALSLGACASRRPRPPVPNPPVPIPEDTRPIEPLDIFVLDAISRPIVGAEVQAEGHAPRRSSGDGHVNFGVRESTIVTVSAPGYETRSVDLSHGTHNVHLVRAAIVVGPGVGQAPWRGRLQIAQNNRGFIDEDGRWILPTLAHFGEAFSAFVRRPADVEAQLVAIKQAGYDGIRFWDTLGYYDSAWGGKDVMPWAFTNRSGHQIPATPGYYDRLRDFLLVLERVGLCSHQSRGDLNGRTTSEVVAHAERVAQIYDEIGWDVLCLFEGNNEDFQNGAFGADGLRRIVEPGKRRGAITASSCPEGCTEEPDDVRAFSAGFSVRYYHGYRGGEATDRLRHIFSTSYEAPEGTPRLAWEGEPTGPNQFPGLGVTVNHTEDVEELGLLAVMRHLARGAWTYMSQYGVFWNGRIERHAGFAAVPRMRQQLEAFAPDVMTWPTLTHGGRADSTWCAPAGCRGGNYFGDPGVSSGPARVDQAISGDRQKVVAIVHGGRGTKVIRNHMNCTATVKVVWPRDDETVQVDESTVPAGGTLDLSNYRTGRMLLAKCAA